MVTPEIYRLIYITIVHAYFTHYLCTVSLVECIITKGSEYVSS